MIHIRLPASHKSWKLIPATTQTAGKFTTLSTTLFVTLTVSTWTPSPIIAHSVQKDFTTSSHLNPIKPLTTVNHHRSPKKITIS